MSAMAAPGLIDLGDIGADQAGRSYPPWRWRAVVAGAVALLCLPGLAGSRPSEVGLSPLWEAHNLWSPEFVVGARAVYAPTLRGPVTALDLETGHTIWTMRADQFPAVLDAGEFAAIGPTSQAATLVVDGSGSVVDTLPGWPVGATRSGRHLLLQDEVVDPDCPVSPWSCTRLSAWDLGDRTRAWSTVIHTLGVEADESGRIVGVASVANDGSLEVRDPDSGRVRGRMGPVPLGDPSPFGMSSVILVRDTVATVVPVDRDVLITAYRLPAPDAAWSLRLPVSELAPVDDRFNLTACGEMLCFEVGAVGTTFIDPGRGTVGLTMPHRVVGRLDGLLVTTSRIFQTGEDCLGCWDVSLVDPRTGPIATYPGSVAVPWTESDGHGLIATRGTAGTGFTVLGPDGTARAIGAVPGVQIRCSARRDVLICYGRNELRAWRLPVHR